MFKDIKAFLSSFMKKAKGQHLFRKYLGITLIGILAFLIPATIIFCYIHFREAPPSEASPEISITLFDNNGHTISAEKTTVEAIEDSPFIKTIYSLINTKIQIEKPEDFKKELTFNLTLTNGSDTSTFKCYFEKISSSSFIEDANGNFFLPNESDYIEFLSSPFSQPVYPEATPPSLSLGESTIIIPSEIDWSYALIDDSLQKSDGNETTSDTLSYMIDGIVKFNFSLPPDECNIKMFDTNGELVFEGSNEDISTFSANEGDEFSVSVHAKWNAKEGISAYGEQKYNFDMICTKPSEIKVSSNSVLGGKLIVVSVSNVNSAESIIYTPKEPNIPNDASEEDHKALTTLYEYLPTFTLNEQNAYALIPIPQNVPTSVFEFSVAYGIAKANFSISLAKNTSSTTLPISTEDFSLDISSAKDEFETTVTKPYSGLKDILLFTSEFLSPEEYGFTKAIDYNTTISVNNESSFKFFATAYTSSNNEATSVKNANIGTVASVGYSKTLGNYVVIDHGAGLYTWYFGLSDVCVAKGTILKKGEFIGYSGSTSPLCSNGVNVLCTLFGNLIDPSEILGQKLI